jgi:hypothetical protein
MISDIFFPGLTLDAHEKTVQFLAWKKQMHGYVFIWEASPDTYPAEKV